MQPVLFLSHGGGPLPLLNDPSHQPMLDTFSAIKQALNRLENLPSAIILISAHWQADNYQITGAKQPELIYDYYGFPAESYAIEYPANGNPELAEQIFAQLTANQLSASINQKRGYDHGMFVPLKLLYPSAHIPVIQVSLNLNDDPAEHIKLGEKLAHFRKQNVLMIGSGFSFHQIPAFFNPAYHNKLHLAEAFHLWLDQQMIESSDYPSQKQALINWQTVEGANFSHPTADHILPLHVCLGIAQNTVTKTYSFKLNQWPARCYWWD
ncbi:dioxygenase [Catenovulum sp. 2E275]|uniref:DODA-type extradiol aromatic ring-opening family dioxygenase n=1 Tax=Catenovulum sp. 2E275 TaxID=2980497 RepID=UPI0021D110AB|nr:class III extradiol ring-cleavage dioxygenase [Catenovulum sp. 2E275]MCU4677277.1 dioxygenase [Catenovulum sp. 2E275]